MKRNNKTLLPLAAVLFTGCERAPAVDVMGTFFPVWMICLSIALLLTFGVRFVLAKVKLETEVGPLAVFYPSLVVLFSCTAWLLFYK